MSVDVEKKSKKKSRSKRPDSDEDDYVEKEVRKAMKQVEKAMGQVRMAEKEGKRAQKLGRAQEKTWSEGNVSYGETSTAGMRMGGMHDKGGTAFVQNNVHNIAGTYIHVESAENIQIGSHNTMVVCDKPKKGRRRSSRKSSSDGDEDGAEAERKHNIGQDKDPSEMTEAEKRIYDLLHSERLIIRDDMNAVCEHVGNWRRFLRLLGLEDALLEQLHQDFYVEGVRQIIYQGLITWQRKADKTATLGVLATTLQKVGYMDALQYLKL